MSHCIAILCQRETSMMQACKIRKKGPKNLENHTKN